ncbi:RES family NAD+ phosphorylase [Thiohalocapsa sp. ML1]|uniref:RES family NAD+ phosphorylase n=1 Tax=Thiohalocapsa sp. ML1 TaxID=1431688 RepID=UPI0007321C73|nr:RES family NAD+ phosphorylase [Thiohalocapsa sp. ML1]
MLDLWPACAETLCIAPLGGELLRMVESQQQVATLSLVDDLAEQALLEELLERSKPPLVPGSRGLHYLLGTPFRYPPLRHGSRFGGRFEPSLFYGARGQGSLLAEVAYYRFVFWSAMAEPPPSGRLRTQHSLFRARCRGERGVRLQEPPCAAHDAVLRDAADYGPTQRLGAALREAGIDLIEYVSARDPERGINVALFRPEALVSRAPLGLSRWLCETRAQAVSFAPEASSELHVFALDTFLVDGRLPRPA